MVPSPESSEGPVQQRLTQRLRRIERRWKAGQLRMMDRRWWQTWNHANTSLLVAVMFAAALIPLDLAFWDDTPLYGAVRHVPVGVFQVSLAVLLVVNALLLDVFLVWRTREDVTVEPGVRLVRFLAGSLPLLGFYVINFWQWVLAREPRWALRKTSPRGSGRFYRAAAQALTRSRALSIWMPLWLYAGNGLFLIALGAKLNELRLFGVAAFGADVFQVALHVGVCCCLVDYVYDHVRKDVVVGWPRTLLWTLPWLALPTPFPFAFASLGTLLALENGHARKKTLCWMAFRHGNSVERLAAWSYLQGVLDKSFGITRHRLRFEGPARSEHTGRVGRQLTAVYRLKTFLLGVDSLALGWLLSRMVQQQPDRQALVDSVVALLTWATLLGVAAAFLLAVSRTLARSLGPPGRRTLLDAHAYGSLLSLGLVFALVGLHFGIWLRQGNVRQAALLVMLLLGLGNMLAGLTIILQPVLRRIDLYGEDRHDDGVWLLFFLALMLASGLMAIDEDAARTGTTVLVVTALLSPVWHLGLAVVSRVFMLREWPDRQRWLLLVTLASPLGGLAVPYWIVTRRRHGAVKRSG